MEPTERERMDAVLNDDEETWCPGCEDGCEECHDIGESGA
jgi:hypothetical protein